jgi:fibronectin-binding autotransporter adhesin
VLSTDAAIGGSGPINIGADANATLQYRGATATVSRAISLAEGGGTFDVTQSGTAYTLSGVVSGIGLLTKSGPGTLVLSGINDYQGGTTISGGTLLANGQTGVDSGTGTGPVAVNSGGTLGGTGRVAGAVTVSSGGALAPGAEGAGALTVAGNTVLNNGAHLAVSAAAAGTNTSVIVEGAGTTFNFQTGSVLDLSLLPGFGSGSAYTVVAMPAGAGGNVQLDGSGTGNGQVLGTFVQGTGASGSVTIVPSGFTLMDGDTFLLSRSGDAVLLTFQPVPEPATVMGIAAGALGLGGLVRRRLRKTIKA